VIDYQLDRPMRKYCLECDWQISTDEATLKRRSRKRRSNTSWRRDTQSIRSGSRRRSSSKT